MPKAKEAAEAEAVEFETPPDGALTIDLSGTDENFTPESVPRGIHAVVVQEVTFDYSQRSNNPMWTWILEIEDGEFAGRRLYYHTVFSEGGMPRVKKALMIVGATELLEKAFNPEEVAMSGVLVGRRARARTTVRPYQGRMTTSVRDLLPATEGGGDDFLSG